MTYLVSLLVGIGVGAAYALLGVKSPAPPVIALFGLLGIVIGEQGLPWMKRWVADRPPVASGSSIEPSRASGPSGEAAR